VWRGRPRPRGLAFVGTLKPRRPAIHEDFVTLARVLKTQGRHGEIAVELHTSNPNRFSTGMHLFALGQDDQRREIELEGFWPHKGSLVLKLKGVDSINDAETFLRCELQVPRAQRAELEPGAAYISDLVGCEVIDRGRSVGNVTAVQFGAGEAPLLVLQDGKQEYLLPFADAFLEAPAGGTALDVDHKKIYMRLPEGLLDVHAPSSMKQDDESTHEKA
jgi:16S rRNA processing protein RimM